MSSKLDAWSMDLLKVYAACSCRPLEKRFSKLACTELYAEFAIVSWAKMLEKTGTASGGQFVPVAAWQFGEEKGRMPTKLSVCPEPATVAPFGMWNVDPLGIVTVN